MKNRIQINAHAIKPINGLILVDIGNGLGIRFEMPIKITENTHLGMATLWREPFIFSTFGDLKRRLK